MAPLFRPKHNTLAQISLFVAAAGAAGVPLGLMLYARTPYARDCRYCHNTVDRSPAAGIPQTQLCLNCHSQVWNKSPLLEPVRESFFKNTPIKWNRVYQVPEFVYFNHSIHVNKGVGCVSCHGRVDEMPAVEKATPLTMSWCLECHRRPEANIRPLEEVTNMEWKPKGDPEEAGRLQAAKNNVHTRTSCTTCHR